MNKRIRENDIENALNYFNEKKHEKIKICFEGFIKQEIIIKNPNILFNNKKREIIIKNLENKINISLAYVEEIYFEQKNKLKFLMENELEILIIFL